MKFELDPKRSLKLLLGFTAFLLCMNAFGIVAKQIYGLGRLDGLIPMFDFATEKNIPTLFSTFTLAAAALLLWLIAASHKRAGEYWRHWAVMALVFLFLSIDEVSMIHEHLIEPVRTTFHTSGLLYFAWVIPYGMGVTVLGGTYLKFMLRLPRDTMKMFVVSFVIFVSGAVGFEMVGGMHFETYGNDLLYAVYYTCEELLEMVGVAVFIYALMRYIAGRFDSLSITVSENNRIGLETSFSGNGQGHLVLAREGSQSAGRRR